MSETVISEITDILAMPPGASVVYHRGFLARDRGPMPGMKKTLGVPRDTLSIRARVEEAAKIAWKLHAAGKVILVQRRVGDMVYDYIAVRRSEPKRKKDTSGALASQLRVLA